MKSADVFPLLNALMGQDTRSVTILVTQMDPDAIGSALALKLLLQQGYGRNTLIYYCGGIGHKQNETIMNLLDLWTHFREIHLMPQSAPDALDMQLFSLVDSASIYDARLGKLKGKVEPRLVIDHHRGPALQNPKEGDIVWLETQLGSASTMLVELWRMYFEANSGKVTPNDYQSMFIALCMGIYTDTSELIQATKRDREAWDWLMTYVQPEDLKPFMNYPLDKQQFVNEYHAWENQVSHGSVLVSNCGYMDVKHGDDLSTIANRYLRISQYTQVYLWGIIEGKIRVSVRSEDVSLPLDQHLRAIFGEASGAKVSKDGHGEGGALIMLDFPAWIPPETKDQVLELVKRSIEVMIFGLIDKMVGLDSLSFSQYFNNHSISSFLV